MRIVIVTNTFPSHSETFISNKVKWLSQKNEIFVLCSGKNENFFDQLFKGNKAVKVYELNTKNLLKKALLNPLKTIFSLIKNGGKRKKVFFRKTRLEIINSFSPDIVHFEFSGIATDYLNEIEDIKGHTVVSCRGSAEKVKLLNDNTRRENIQKLFDKIDAVHCVSDDMRRTVLPYCTHPEKIFINYPSIDTSVFTGSDSSKKNDCLTILSIGRFTFQKGYLTGLLTIKKLQQKNINFKWVIVGDGLQKEEIIFYIHQLQLQDRVELLGIKNAEEIIGLYKQADIFFLPSVYEGIANVALEAMSMQLPVVSTKAGGMNEVITNGLNGFLADVYDAEALANNISMLAEDIDLRRKIGNAARARIITAFNIGTQIEKFEKVYHNLIKIKS